MPEHLKSPPESSKKVNRISFKEITPETNDLLTHFGSKPLNIYRILAHNPSLLNAWLKFANAIRNDNEVPRSLRELMILRSSQISNSEYEWFQHRPMAMKAGVKLEQIENLENWTSSPLFSSEEKVALKFTEAVMNGNVTDELDSEMNQYFTAKQKISLTLTASFYAMVPRVLNALQVPIEGRE